MFARYSEKQTFAALFLTAGSLLFGCAAGAGIYQWALLLNSNSVAAAWVTAERFNPCVGRRCGGTDPYEIKYQFNVAPDTSIVYVYTGLFSEGWVRVPKRVWEPAARTKQINVVYATQNPRINHPAALDTESVIWAFGLALFALINAVVAALTWRGYKF